MYIIVMDKGGSKASSISLEEISIEEGGPAAHHYINHMCTHRTLFLSLSEGKKGAGADPSSASSSRKEGADENFMLPIVVRARRPRALRSRYDRHNSIVCGSMIMSCARLYFLTMTKKDPVRALV